MSPTNSILNSSTTSLNSNSTMSTISPSHQTNSTIVTPSNSSKIDVEATISTKSKVREKARNGIIDTSLADHPCTINYDGSSGGMESDGLLLLILELEKKMKGRIYYETIVTDDDTKLKKYIKHTAYKPRGFKNIGGVLPSNIPEPKWFADPTHRAKCVAGAFFEMTKGAKSSTRCMKIDALRMKKYYSYYIKQNRTKDLEYIMKYDMAPLFHLFDQHHLCDSSWCHKKSELDKIDGDEKEEVPVDSKSERSKQGYYRCMTKDADLFEAMKEKYSKYISKTYLEHCIHSFDTQMNEGMNNSVAKYTSIEKHYKATKSLLTRVFIADGVQLVGHHFF